MDQEHVEHVEHSDIKVWDGKELKKKIIRTKVDESDGVLLLVGTSIRIVLASSVLEMAVTCEQLDVEQKKYAFKIYFDKEYIFVCNDFVDTKYWIETLEPHTQIYGVVGLPLELAVRKSGWRVPNFVYRSIQCLRNNGAIHTQGLFRLTGAMDEIEEIRGKVDLDQDIGEDFNKDNILVGSFLKNCLKLMVEPIIPFDKSIDFSRLKTSETPKEFVNSLPKCSQDTLFLLIQFLLEVCANEQENKMTKTNMATCFALCVCKLPPATQHNEMLFTVDCIGSFEYMLDNFENLFEEIRKRNEEEGMEFPKNPAFMGIPHFDYSIIYQQNKMYSKTNRGSKRLSVRLGELVHRSKSRSPSSDRWEESEIKIEQQPAVSRFLTEETFKKKSLPAVQIQITSPDLQTQPLSASDTPRDTFGERIRKKESLGQKFKRKSAELFFKKPKDEEKK